MKYIVTLVLLVVAIVNLNAQVVVGREWGDGGFRYLMSDGTIVDHHDLPAGVNPHDGETLQSAIYRRKVELAREEARRWRTEDGTPAIYGIGGVVATAPVYGGTYPVYGAGTTAATVGGNINIHTKHGDLNVGTAVSKVFGGSSKKSSRSTRRSTTTRSTSTSATRNVRNTSTSTANTTQTVSATALEALYGY